MIKMLTTISISNVKTRLFLSLVLVFCSNGAAAITSYHIGNSLTWDVINAEALEDLFARGGAILDANHHIRCGSSLNGILNNPDDACNLSADGPWSAALVNNVYDVLILQPHESASSTETEIIAMQAFASMSSAQVAIYEAYPGYAAAVDILSYYLLPDHYKFRQTQAEFAKIRTAFPDAVIIPVMEVLIELDSRARNGDIPGINTAQDFYRDSRHLNNFGKYALGITFYSSLTHLYPSLTGDRPRHERYEGVTKVQASVVQSVVKKVVLGISTDTSADTNTSSLSFGFNFLVLSCLIYRKRII